MSGDVYECAIPVNPNLPEEEQVLCEKPARGACSRCGRPRCDLHVGRSTLCSDKAGCDRIIEWRKRPRLPDYPVEYPDKCTHCAKGAVVVGEGGAKCAACGNDIQPLASVGPS